MIAFRGKDKNGGDPRAHCSHLEGSTEDWDQERRLANLLVLLAHPDEQERLLDFAAERRRELEGAGESEPALVGAGGDWLPESDFGCCGYDTVRPSSRGPQC